MAKCGKGCMPECEYFTTGGCISPFNCPYKIETGYINSATSIPTYMEQYNGMSDDNIKRLKAENADLHARLKEAEHCAEVAERALLIACVNLIKDVEDNVNMELLAHMVYTKFLGKAEKELAEEEKK